MARCSRLISASADSIPRFSPASLILQHCHTSFAPINTHAVNLHDIRLQSIGSTVIFHRLPCQRVYVVVIDNHISASRAWDKVW